MERIIIKSNKKKYKRKKLTIKKIKNKVDIKIKF